MATERILESLSNRLMDLDHKIMVTAEETYKFVEIKKNTCTVKKMKSDINRFRTWLADDGETRDIEDIVPQELDMYLSRFFLSAKNIKTKQELEPGTLRGINSSIRRYLVEKNYIVDPVNAKEFKHSRDTLKAKSVDLKEKGLGNKSSRADPFTGDEIKELYEKKLLGKETPYSLVSTLWMNNTQHLGLRGRQEHITMLWGDLELKKTITGRRYLEFSERATKTRKSITDDARLFKTKVFEQKDCGYQCIDDRDYYVVSQERCDIFHRCYKKTAFTSYCAPGTFFDPHDGFCACRHTTDLPWCQANGALKPGSYVTDKLCTDE